MITTLPLKSLKLLSHQEESPSIAVLFPFDPKMSEKQGLMLQLKQVLSKAEAAILQKYSSDKSLEFIHRLRQVMGKLNYNTHKKSVAIFLSQETEKIMYLNLDLKEKIEVAGDFSMRDLVLQKKSTDEFLVLVMEGERSRIYDVENNSFKLIMEQPGSILRQLDYGLSVLTSVNPFPVFVMGARKLLAEFSKVTANASGIVKYISSYKNGIQTGLIRQLLAPYMTDQRKIYQLFLAQKLITARDSEELVCGLENVQSPACRTNNGLLLVDREFSSRRGMWEVKRPFYIHDEVDQVIERTLANGGDVELVDQDMLKDYGRIALLQNQTGRIQVQSDGFEEKSCFVI